MYYRGLRYFQSCCIVIVNYILKERKDVRKNVRIGETEKDKERERERERENESERGRERKRMTGRTDMKSAVRLVLEISFT